MSLISKVDSVGIPSRDWKRSKEFYVETLGLRPDERSQNEFWIGDTCFGIWEPERWDMQFRPAVGGFLLRVDDVDAARKELEANGIEFDGETADSGVCRMATFHDPDGNELVLHNRYAPYRNETSG